MLRVYLIRHAQSKNNAQPDFEKHEFDPALTELGIQQSHALGRHLKTDSDNGEMRRGYAIKNIYSSPQLRALQTTLILTEYLDIQPEIWVRTHERGGVVVIHRKGIMHHHGITREEIRHQFPTFKLPYQITNHGWWKGYGSLETNKDVFVRARVVANELFLKARMSNNQGVVLVSHGTFINFLLQVLLGDSENRYIHNNTGISRIDIDRNITVTLRYFNHTSHLDGQLIS